MSALLARVERLAIVLTPVVGLSIVGVTLTFGASTRVRGVRVYGAAPGHGRSGLALTLEAVEEEAGVKELVRGEEIDVVASMRGERATWHGATNADAVAEAWLELPGVTADDRVALHATDGHGHTLADGSIAAPHVPPSAEEPEPAVAATRRDGALWIDVYLPDGKLVPGSVERVLVRVVDAATRAGVDGASVTLSPEPGLTVATGAVRTADGGFCTVRVTAEFLLAGWTVAAEAGDAEKRTGSWYGALPVAPGAASVAWPEILRPGVPLPLELTVPPASPRVYVEVDDAWGRDFGAALDITAARSGATASVVLPPLAAGQYWLVTSASPRGAEHLTGSTLARPFTVEAVPAGSRPPRVPREARAFERPLVLDGLVEPRAHAARRRHRGVLVALGALVVSCALEALLVLRAAVRARGRLAELSDAADEVAGARIAPQPGTGIAVLVLVSVLGFVLIAALMMVRDAF